jgi:hypothetical protein
MALEKTVINALAEMDMAADVNKVEDIVKIMCYKLNLNHWVLHLPL